MWNNTWSQPFAEEQDTVDTDAQPDAANQQVEYAFEGFTVEFSEKVALLAPSSIGTNQQKRHDEP